MSMPVRWNMNEKICDAYTVESAGTSSVHGHHHFLITLITRGEGVQVLNGESITFGVGDLFVLSPVDFHENRIKSGESYGYIGVKFPYGVIDSRFWDILGNDRFPMHVTLSEIAIRSIRPVMEKLVDECLRSDSSVTSEIMLKALLEQLLVLIVREVPETAGNGGDSFVSRTLGYLHSNFRSPVTVYDAATSAGYTPNYFSAIFKRHFGSPFVDYLKKMRLSYAKNLMLSGDASLTEIALESGFCSLSHFSRTFTREYGVFPTEYRRTNRSNTPRNSKAKTQK